MDSVSPEAVSTYGGELLVPIRTRVACDAGKIPPEFDWASECLEFAAKRIREPKNEKNNSRLVQNA